MRIRVTAAALCTAVLVAGCGGGGGSGDEGLRRLGRGSGPVLGFGFGAGRKGPSGPLGEAQLKSAALTAGDVDGYQITDYPVKPDGDSTARPAGVPAVGEHAHGGSRSGAPGVPGTPRLLWLGPAAGAATTIGLMAYDRSGARASSTVCAPP